jgi:hypothetical protein
VKLSRQQLSLAGSSAHSIQRPAAAPAAVAAAAAAVGSEEVGQAILGQQLRWQQLPLAGSGAHDMLRPAAAAAAAVLGDTSSSAGSSSPWLGAARTACCALQQQE